MRKILLAGLCLFISFYSANSQNKTLGVGAATPNPNAALHVESPTGNQGFIMPRLTTLKREAMNSFLADADKGLMLYDTDLNTVFIWDGKAWKTSSQVAGGPKLVYPYVDTLSTTPSGVDPSLLKIVYEGSAIENVNVAHFANLNPNNSNDALSALTNGLGSAGRFRVNNSGSKMPALWAETNSDSALSAPIYGLNTGTGDVAASFRITNDANRFPALYAETVGNSRVATFSKRGTTGTQPAVFISSLGGHGIWADHNAPTGYAAIIQTINTANTTAGMLVESIGTGPSVWALKSLDAVGGDALTAENWIGTGGVATFKMTNAANPNSAIMVTTAGQGSAGTFEQTDATVWAPALVARSNGQGAALNAVSTASANANAAEFVVQNPANNRNAVMAHTEGTGSAGNFMVNNAASGAASLIAQTAGTGAAIQAQTSTGFAALYARREGASNGNAGLFDIVDAANTYPALQVNTAGTGAAINARHTGASGDALYSEYAGTGDGSAGNFRNSNANNNASAVYADTNGKGPAISANHATKGIALAVWSGGIQITTELVTTPSIANRASAYRITSGGTTFTIDFAPVDGEVFMIYNESGQAITISGGGSNTTLLADEGKTFVAFPGGVIRGF